MHGCMDDLTTESSFDSKATWVIDVFQAYVLTCEDVTNSDSNVQAFYKDDLLIHSVLLLPFSPTCILFKILL